MGSRTRYKANPNLESLIPLLWLLTPLIRMTHICWTKMYETYFWHIWRCRERTRVLNAVIFHLDTNWMFYSDGQKKTDIKTKFWYYVIKLRLMSPSISDLFLWTPQTKSNTQILTTVYVCIFGEYTVNLSVQWAYICSLVAHRVTLLVWSCFLVENHSNLNSTISKR